jgi:hypothetical protein
MDSPGTCLVAYARKVIMGSFVFFLVLTTITLIASHIPHNNKWQWCISCFLYVFLYNSFYHLKYVALMSHSSEFHCYHDASEYLQVFPLRNLCLRWIIQSLSRNFLLKPETGSPEKTFLRSENHSCISNVGIFYFSKHHICYVLLE